MSRPANDDQSGRTASTASASRNSATTQPGPLSPHDRSTTSSSSTARAARICARSASETGPSRRRGGAAKASRSPRLYPQQSGAALLHGFVVALRQSPGLEPGMGTADGRVTGERQLLARGEDPEAVWGAPRETPAPCCVGPATDGRRPEWPTPPHRAAPERRTVSRRPRLHARAIVYITGGPHPESAVPRQRRERRPRRAARRPAPGLCSTVCRRFVHS